MTDGGLLGLASGARAMGSVALIRMMRPPVLASVFLAAERRRAIGEAGVWIELHWLMVVQAFLLQDCAGRSALAVQVVEEGAVLVFAHEEVEGCADVGQQLLDEFGGPVVVELVLRADAQMQRLVALWRERRLPLLSGPSLKPEPLPLSLSLRASAS